MWSKIKMKVERYKIESSIQKPEVFFLHGGSRYPALGSRHQSSLRATPDREGRSGRTGFGVQDLRHPASPVASQDKEGRSDFGSRISNSKVLNLHFQGRFINILSMPIRLITLDVIIEERY